MRRIRAGGREAGTVAGAMGEVTKGLAGTYQIAYILVDISAQTTAEHLMR